MPKPITPFVGCDVFVTNDKQEILLIQRSDNGLWALPGGCQDLGETPAECAIRECFEETGFRVELIQLYGVFSSKCYEYCNYPWKENEFTHILFQARLIGGEARLSEETKKIAWFSWDALPELSDGHSKRIEYAFSKIKNLSVEPYFE